MRMLMSWILMTLLVAVPAHVAAQDAKLPKVVLIGDSIRLGYSSIVEKELQGKAVIVNPKANGGDSNNVVKNLEAWGIREQPAVVHFNCGIHDTKKSKKASSFQVPPDKYEANLRAIVERIRKETKAKVLFSLTTPIIDNRATKTRAKVEYELLDASTEEYNRIARKVMTELKVPVNDLCVVIGEGEMREKLMSADGVHFTAEGSRILGMTVAAFIAKYVPEKQ